MSKKIIELADKLKSKIYSDYNAGKNTWFRTGGNAKIFAIVEDNLELEIILNEINNENFYIIGSGSNLLIRDNGYNGTLIKLGKGFNTININDNKLEVGASILDINLSNYALRQNIEGFEFYSGIPGSIGGEIGRASCRERVQISVVAVSLKKNKNTTYLKNIGDLNKLMKPYTLHQNTIVFMGAGSISSIAKKYLNN